MWPAGQTPNLVSCLCLQLCLCHRRFQFELKSRPPRKEKPESSAEPAVAPRPVLYAPRVIKGSQDGETIDEQAKAQAEALAFFSRSENALKKLKANDQESAVVEKEDDDTKGDKGVWKRAEMFGLMDFLKHDDEDDEEEEEGEEILGGAVVPPASLVDDDLGYT